MLHWKDVWVRSMPPGTQVTAAYGELMNHGDQTITISKLTADLGSEAQMHDVIAEGDQRRMVQLEEANIAPGASLVFEPGGRHIMIIGVGESPAEGSQVDICALSAAGTRACTQALVSRQAPGEQDSHDHHGAHSAHHADESPAKGSHHAEGSDHTDAEPAGHSGHHH
jgi:copper(I)-binding protein